MNKQQKPDAFRIKTAPEEVWKEYWQGKEFNMSINGDLGGLYEVVRRNERMVSGDQWHGVKAPDIDKPVLNFLKRAVMYMVAMIVSDNIGINIKVLGVDENSLQGKAISKYLTDNLDEVIEETSMTTKLRRCVRDAAVDGDACLYAYWDAATEAISLEVVANTSCIFGNPIVQTVQEQPYIIIEQHRDVRDVQLQAWRAGLDGWQSIHPDEEKLRRENDTPMGSRTVTVIKKMWRDDDTGHIWFTECTEHMTLVPPTDTLLSVYPVAWMNWDEVKDNYHGAAIVTNLIPNQIAVNRLWAGALWHLRQQAFPKVIYDKSRLPRGWSNRAGEAIGVPNGNTGDVATAFKAPDMSADLKEIVERTVSMTRDFMGVNDVVLGNITPDNTSAIVAVQQSTAAPLELQRMAFYQFVEDIVRVIVNLACANYGLRRVQLEVTQPDPMTGAEVTVEQEVEINFSVLPYKSLKLRVDIGEAAYWSELMQVQTMDNLYSKGLIPDAVAYVESIPDKYLPNKDKLLETMRQAQQTQQGEATVDAAQDMGGGMMPNAMPYM